MHISGTGCEKLIFHRAEYSCQFINCLLERPFHLDAGFTEQMNENEIRDIQQRLNSLKDEKRNVEAKISLLKAELRDFGFKTVRTAENWLKDTRKQMKHIHGRLEVMAEETIAMLNKLEDEGVPKDERE